VGAAWRLRSAAGRLLTRVEHWGQSRWSQRADRGQTRAEAVYRLVQRLADLVAAAEGRPALAVPRLDNDLALPDQVRVMVTDLGLAGAGDDVLLVAAAEIEETSARL
jgi:hypothetical protein